MTAAGTPVSALLDLLQPFWNVPIAIRHELKLERLSVTSH